MFTDNPIAKDREAFLANENHGLSADFDWREAGF
jgi:hypothetical protein